MADWWEYGELSAFFATLLILVIVGFILVILYVGVRSQLGKAKERRERYFARIEKKRKRQERKARSSKT